jgi:hypothetical protein
VPRTPCCEGSALRTKRTGRQVVGLATDIQDVLPVLEYEDLREVVLVGQGYGGMAVATVADRATPLPGAFAWWASILLLLLGARAAQRLPAGDRRAEGKITDRPGDDFESWVARRNLQNTPHVTESAPPPPNNP